MPKVFISYSHKDEAWKDRLQTQLTVLQMEGLLSIWEDRRIQEGDDWYPEIQQALDSADVAILLITAEFLTSEFIRGEEIPRLLERREKEGIRVIPLILKPCPWRSVQWLASLQGASRDNVELSGLSEHEQDAALSRLAERVHQLIEGRGNPSAQGKSRPARSSIHVDRLPTVPGDLFGREPELQILDNALAGEDTRIIQFVAAGGTGKTKLLRHWLNQHEADISDRIVWSFYSQGTSEDKQVSASPLFTEAFKQLGIDPESLATEEDRADALAEALIARRCLLVLDGLEPLQHGGRGMDGRLKERAIARLIKTLAQRHTGLCIITTRIPVHELTDQPRVISHPLDNLSTGDGIRLLQSLGAEGTARELKKAVTEVEGHALTLHLLGNAVGTYLGGDIGQRDTLAALIDDFDEQGRHAFKVMQAYERWLTDEQGKPLPELQLLYLLGLFDHPIETEVLEVLWQAAIPGLTEGIPERAWKVAIRDLRERHRLLSQHPERPDLLDCHPLIREWFGRRLEHDQPEAWRQAHERLYDYYRDLPEREQPDTLAEMQPLFSSVAHGCAAGSNQRVLVNVYWPRVMRGQEAYLVKKLGAFSDNLAVIAHFFTKPWKEPASDLGEAERAGVLSWAGFGLQALGRLREAQEPMLAGMEASANEEDWRGVAQDAVNFAELQIALGNLEQAVEIAQYGLAQADRSGDYYCRLISRTAYAIALTHTGEAEAALGLFRETERLQQENQPEFPRLYSNAGFHYCDLLLARAGADFEGVKEVLERAELTLEWATIAGSGLMSIALDKLTLGRAYLQRALLISDADKDDLCQSREWLDQAVTEMREAGRLDYLPLALIPRATLCRLKGDFSFASKDLREIHDIAEPSEMRLYLTDYHLESARLALARSESGSSAGTEKARYHTEEAAELIEATGYNRRLPELEALRELL